MNTRLNLAATLGLFVLALAFWEAAIQLFAVPGYILPPPSQVAVALWRGLSSGLYLTHGAYTVTETVLGFLIGSCFGILLGTAIALNRYVEYFLHPYIIMFQSMPKVALAPMFALWFGLGIASKIFAAAVISFFPVMVNTVVGLRSADDDRVSLMASLGASRMQIFRYLRLPGALPFILAGLDIAVILSLIGAIVAEFVGAQAGLGTLIQSMNFNMDVAGQFSVLLVLSAIGLSLSRLIKWVRRRVLFWDTSEKSRDRSVHL